MTAFRATQTDHRSGYHVTFKNGCTVSVQFGSTTYSDQGETTAEVAAWDPDGTWIKIYEHDNVKGYCSPDEVLEIMNTVASLDYNKVDHHRYDLIYLAVLAIVSLGVIAAVTLLW